MKITWREATADIFAEREADVLVNPVNCVGTSGKGLALEFKRRFPYAQRDYARACAERRLVVGQVVFSPAHAHALVDEQLGIYRVAYGESSDEAHSVRIAARPTFIAHLPTKRHWRDSSKLADIARGLDALVREARRHKSAVVAIPALGCGNGGLFWSEVRELLTHKLSVQTAFQPIVFLPH